MAFQYLTNVPLEQARKEYLALLIKNGLSAKAERVPVQETCGRVTAEAVYAHICAPHYPASAMDGIALKAKDTFGATETTPVVLAPEQYVVVDTGDPIPDGCDAVVMVEDVVESGDGRVKLYAAAAPWQHIRQIGEDICAGEMILTAGMAVTPASIGAMIAGGVLDIQVVRRPVVGIIPTGDEIVPPCSDPMPGDILEFNSVVFSAMLRQWGAEARTLPIVPDEFNKIKAAVSEAVENCDMVILNAGSSAGREDFSAQVIREVGHVLYHGIAMKPGKPAILGYCGCKPVLGVPGYPVSGIVVIEELLRPIIEYCLQRPAEKNEYAQAVISRAVVSGLKYQEFIRVRMGYVGNKLVAAPLNRGSGVVSSFMKADGILEVPQGVEGYQAGEAVRIRLLKNQETLRQTLVAIGSHDPLLDEVANLMHMADRETYMSSSHVGSMGGIMAVRRGETHVAGCHLLNGEDGSYNTAFIEKYFPQGGVRLVECVGRQQGLMLQKGNPQHIARLADIARPGIRYVNRQKGSGTRMLTDYLCKRENIRTSEIYGYEREEFTHTSVAAQLASGSGDAGMGIYSAAKLYDLDFLPICMEQYDLLIPDYAWDMPLVQRLITTMRSAAFREKLISMGGYRVENPGAVRQRF